MKSFKPKGGGGGPARPAMGFQPSGGKRVMPGGAPSSGPASSGGVQKPNKKGSKKGESIKHKIRGIERLLKKVRPPAIGQLPTL